MSAAPFFIADDAGFFRDEGIRLEFTDAPMRSTQALPLLEKGSIDVVSTTVSAGIFAAAHTGARFRIVADRGHVTPDGCDFNGMVGASSAFSSPVPTPADVRGKIISINTAVTAEFVTDRFLESLGLTQRDMKVTSMSEVMEPQALNSGAIHLTYATEPYISRLRADGHHVFGRIARYADKAHYGVIIFGPTLTVSHRDIGQRFMNAYLRGVRRNSEGATDANVAAIAKRMGFEPELLRKACFATIHGDGLVDPAWMMTFQRWAVAKGYLSDSVAIDRVTDPAFARAAAARLDSAVN
jgi:NitT/TauT family transport system substrate-binding protein